MPSRSPRVATQHLPPIANPVQALEVGLKLKAVERLWQAGQLAEALQACNDILKTHPTHAGALYTFGMLALELGALEVAIGAFERAAAGSPGTVRILIGLGQAQAKAGQLVKAAATYAKALQLSPNSGPAWRGLGLVQLDLDQRGQALKSFRKALKINSGDGFATYMLAALADDAPPPQAGYVASLFDSYAEQFDQHLTGRLGYRIPQEIATMVAAHSGGQLGSAVDLGCGTGLVGAALNGRVTAMDGMDLSLNMLAKAEARGVYRHLKAGDAAALLGADSDFSGPYELVTAADVFIYIGRLEAVFGAVADRLAPGGLFAFSVESATHGDVEIRSSGRFAHSAGYIATLAGASGFQIAEARDLIVRLEIDTPVPGTLYLLERG